MVTAPTPARVHLAVVAGPDSGWSAGLQAEPLVVGRTAAADLTIADQQLSRRHLVVRYRRGRVQVRDLGSANGTRWRGLRSRPGMPERWRRRTRGVHRRWRTVRPGDRLHAGASTFEVRHHPALRTTTTFSDSPSVAEGLGTRLLLPIVMLAGTVPMLLSSGAGRWRLVVAIAMPILLVTAVVWPLISERIRQGRRSGSEEQDKEPEPPAPALDPAGALFTAHQPLRTAGPRWEIGNADRAGPAPRLDEGGRARIRRARRAARWIDPAAGGTGLALVGAQAGTAGLARWLLCQLALAHPPGALAVHAPPSWTWIQALPQGRSRAITVRVLDMSGPGGRGAPSAEDTGPAPPGGPEQESAIDLVLARDVSRVPSWCAQIVEVRPEHNRQVSPAWAAMITTALRQADSSGQGLPEAVSLWDLMDTDQVLLRWSEAGDGLTALLGRSDQGLLELDLVATGPHAVVAGTTGSGKSELLLTLVLSLALRYPPADLAFVLIDYKGGATFSAVTGLPHVLGLLTDLDASATARALASLRAELRRREELLAEAGVANLAAYRRRHPEGQHLARLMVIVDEFRVLADEHADFLDALVRLAAQGRSLGIHLVLATQRPGGAITADMRANLTVRICLRVLQETDSLDVLGTPAAADLPGLPGRAILRTEQSSVFQAAWCGSPEQITEVVGRLNEADSALSTAEPWRAQLHPPWAPPLPERLELTELPSEQVADAALIWLRTDLPEQQRLGISALQHPGTVLISGPPHSGRTSAARTLAVQAMGQGLSTHLLTDDEHLPTGLSDGPALGTVCTPEEIRRAHRLLDLLGTADGRTPQVLVIDEVASWSRALEEAGGHGAGDVLQTLVRRSRRLNLTVVITAVAPAHQWANQVAEHLVLAPRDPADAVLMGVPRGLAGRGWPPGRGVLLSSGQAVLGQVALSGAGAPDRAPPQPPLRIRALPEQVDAATRPAQTGRVWLGVGGDDGRWLDAELPPGGTWLIAGNNGTGRSTALRMIAEQLRAQGRRDVLYLDDVDRLGATELAGAADHLRQHAAALVATARPEALLNTYHDIASRLRDAVTMVLLSPASPHLTGADLRTQFDPGQTWPGRGVLWHRGRPEPLQCAAVVQGAEPLSRSAQSTASG